MSDMDGNIKSTVVSRWSRYQRVGVGTFGEEAAKHHNTGGTELFPIQRAIASYFFLSYVDSKSDKPHRGKKSKLAFPLLSELMFFTFT